ncbi:hypothetical protein L0B53_04340 [Vibrio sp. SS-MA-C1-2]|uniref:imm11 family protein n=1 Tax=Vibrio sp. SS-MA-C1-2 TaxID=2908646 RepID=UPI001F1D7455|nr:DUF1629 domain-containing protein [Vibrio sp. SS-MA-C1-2]UJF17152.1 hypothetical protein L0B53_04340 [Vibrio sp. SS-MA-C1-2]
MKYWELYVTNEGAQIFVDVTKDYVNQTIFADTTGKEGEVKGNLNDDYPLFFGPSEEVFSHRLVTAMLQLNPEGVTTYPITLKLPDGTLNTNWCEVTVSAYVDCIDFNASTLKLRNNGKIRFLRKLVLDTEKADRAGYDIFRLHHRFTSIIVSDRLKQAIEVVNPIGIRFNPTDGSE